MKLVIMTKSTFFVEEDKILSVLFSEGLNNLHLYKPSQPTIYSERLLTLLPEEYHKQITVHENYYLKKEFGLAGIHLDSATEPVPNGYKGHYSRTCDNLSELRAAKRNADYVFLSHVADNDEGYSLQALEDAADEGLIDRHVYAYGGIRLDNIALMKSLGFGGVVIDNDLWDRFDIQMGVGYSEVIDQFVKIRKASE